MKPVKQPNQPINPNQPPTPIMQGISDDMAIQIMNKMRTKGNAAQIAIDEIVGEMGQLFAAVVNAKNNEIAALKELLAKKEVEEKKE